jgi:UDP-glucose 4-epimerase
MKIVVFGGAGFLGSHVADVLSEEGHRVTVCDRRPSPFLPSGARMMIADITDEKQVARAVKGQEIVFNFAGFSDIEQAQNQPLETIRSNVLGNAVILEACRRLKVKRYLFASTVYVYSDAASFYRASKLACEAYIDVYQRLHGLACTLLRFGSLYGPRAAPGNGIRGFLWGALRDGRVSYWGSGDEVRDYIYVRDAALCCLDALRATHENECLLITGGQSIKMRDLLTMIREIFRGRVRIDYRPGSRPDLADLHYRITPYAYVPRPARKIMRPDVCDLGQGLLNVLKELEALRDGPPLEV